MTCKVELIPISEGNRITVKENEKIIVGRGSSLGCNDKKISRQHAELLLKKDQTLWIKPTHTNPVFYRPTNGKTIHLTKDIEQELKDGDQFGLLPTTFFFRVSFSTDKTNNQDESISESTNNHTDGLSAASSVKDQDKSQSSDSDEKSRKLPNWMTTTKTSPSDKRQLSPEKHNNSKTDESSKMSDTKTTVANKSSKPITFDDNDDDVDSVSPKKIKSSVKRSACQFGASCYRKNPAHRSEESHPGDSDYEDEKSKNSDAKHDKAVDKLPCPYGKTCYRQNPQHKLDYKH